MPAKKISRSVWVALLALGFAGALAWAVENQFFNTFVYDRISPDPRPIAWMVAASAITATLTTLLMGTLSDRTRTRWGRRRPYLLLGYILWGILTALFPTAAVFHPIGMAVAMAIIFDSVMTFFGSTANDGALNAYVADVTTLENRGRVIGAMEIMKWIATLIVYGGAGLIIEMLGYDSFFYIIGGLVLVLGLVGGLLVREEPVTTVPQGTYWSQIFSTFQLKNLIAHRDFFLVSLGIMAWGIAQQVFFPYLMIYLQHYIQLPTIQSSILIGIAILVGGILMAYPAGILTDRWGRRRVALLAVAMEMVGLTLFGLSHNFVFLLITGVLWLAPMAAWTISTGSWTKDLFPEDQRGQFAGLFMIFFVALPMVPGPLLGSWISTTWGVPTILDGKAGVIPGPAIFFAAAAMTLLAAIPIYFAREKKA